MKAHVNFYETLKEAHIRLRNTVVLYDSVPYYVMAITNHMKDGIFRIYLAPLDETPGGLRKWPDIGQFNPDNPGLGPYIDKWLEQVPDSGVLRKQMNSPLFDKYRPFPLGMCNQGNRVVYLERAPARPKTEQGLIGTMIQEVPISLRNVEEPYRGKTSVSLTSFNMHNCITANHPDPQTCLTNLLSDEYQNEAAAFHREFALVKGPIGMVFLAYKTDVVGVLPKNNFEYLRLGKHFLHLREVCLDLGLFTNID